MYCIYGAQRHPKKWLPTQQAANYIRKLIKNNSTIKNKMKRIFFLFFSLAAFSCFLLISFSCHHQIATNSDSRTLAVDTTYENLLYQPIMNINYNILRPNQQVTVTGDLHFNENFINPGYSGKVRFVLTGTSTITVNGHVINEFPTSGTFIRTYSNSKGIISWK
jgi:hypothetical protein